MVHICPSGAWFGRACTRAAATCGGKKKPETMYKLWINAGHLPPEQKKRAREKALRFLHGTSGCKPWPITVLSDSSRTLAVARRYVRAAIKELGTFAGSETVDRERDPAFESPVPEPAPDVFEMDPEDGPEA